jgi:hypothetical protein
MDLLNHKEGGMVFLLSPLQCTVTEIEIHKRLLKFKNKNIRGCASLKKYKSQGKAVEGICE